MRSDREIKDQIVEIGRRLYANRFIAASEGNISVRAGDVLYFTPTARCKGELKRKDIVKTDLNGRKLGGLLEPSSESPMHVEVYRRRADVQAVVHAHPPYATGFAVAGLSLEKAVLPEVVVTLGSIPLVKYRTPTTDELAVAIRPLLPHHDALLLANHGALTMDADLVSAYFKMETLEHFAWVSFIARSLGREQVLSRKEVARLRAFHSGKRGVR
jgi:L-fuculose-phosphate aldolase